MSQINEDIVDQLGGKSHPRLVFVEDGGPRLLTTVWDVGNRVGPGWAAWAGAGFEGDLNLFEVRDQLAAWDGSVFRVLRSRQTSAPSFLLLQCGTRLSSERERILSEASKLEVLVPHLTAFISNYAGFPATCPVASGERQPLYDVAPLSSLFYVLFLHHRRWARSWLGFSSMALVFRPVVCCIPEGTSYRCGTPITGPVRSLVRPK